MLAVVVTFLEGGDRLPLGIRSMYDSRGRLFYLSLYSKLPDQALNLHR